MKITIALDVFDKKYAKDVEGEILDIAPHLASVATFIVHKSPWFTGWQISHVESGKKVGAASLRTKQQAIEGAKIILDGHNVNTVLAAYKRQGIK